MATITLKGNPITTIGELPAIGSQAPDFRLTTNSFEDVGLNDFAGKRLILNIVSSLDTGICANSAKRFNDEVARLDDTVVLTVSADLPFAQARFCQAEGIDNVITVSQLRNRDFGKDYGVEITSGPTTGLLSRAVVVVGTDGKVKYTQQVPEIAQEPDYDDVLANLG